MSEIKDVKKYEKLGESYRAIAKHMKLNFRTVKKYSELKDFNELPKQTRIRKAPKKLDNAAGIIDSWLIEDMLMPQKQRHTAKRIFERLENEYAGVYAGGIRQLEKYVAARKAELNCGEKNCFLKLEHSGGEAQADFGEALVLENEVLVTAHYFVLSFPYSNVGYCIAFKGQNQECLLEALKRIFEHIGKVPVKIWFDNLSAAVITIGKNRDRKLVEQFERFALHYRFIHNFCNPDAGYEKGHVENKVGYDRRNFFVPIPQVKDFKELNGELMKLCIKDMDRVHYAKERKIRELFAEEQPQFKKLPEKSFDVCRYEKRGVNCSGMISFEKNSYSVSPEFAQKEVWVKATAEEIIMLNEKYERITSHLRIYGKHKESFDWQPFFSLILKRPKALKYTGFYNGLPAEWKELFENSDESKCKKLLAALQFMIMNGGKEIALKALLGAREKGCIDSESILATYYRLADKTPVPVDIELPETVPQLKLEWPGVSVYDALLERGVA